MPTPMESSLIAAGYAKSPNNIYSLPGDGWYPIGPGRMETPFQDEIRLVDEQIHINHTTFTGTPYVDMKSHHQTIATLPSVEALEEWLAANGVPKYDGPIYNVWD
jgi:hypothetical protein